MTCKLPRAEPYCMLPEQKQIRGLVLWAGMAAEVFQRSSPKNTISKTRSISAAAALLGATQACMQQCMPNLSSVLRTGTARGTQAGKVVLCAMEDELAPCCWCSMWPLSWLSQLDTSLHVVSARCGNRSEGLPMAVRGQPK